MIELSRKKCYPEKNQCRRILIPRTDKNRKKYCNSSACMLMMPKLWVSGKVGLPQKQRRGAGYTYHICFHSLFIIHGFLTISSSFSIEQRIRRHGHGAGEEGRRVRVDQRLLVQLLARLVGGHHLTRRLGKGKLLLCWG